MAYTVFPKKFKEKRIFPSPYLHENNPSLARWFWGLAMGFCFFGFEILRSSLNSIFKSHYGPDKLPLSLVFVPLQLIFFLFLYSYSLKKQGPHKTLLWFQAGFFVLLSLGTFFFMQGYEKIIFFLLPLREGYVLVLSEQIWSLIHHLDAWEKVPLSSPFKNYRTLSLASLGSFLGALCAYGSDYIKMKNLFSIAIFSFIPMIFCSLLAIKQLPKWEKNHRPQTPVNFRNFKEYPVLLFLLILTLGSQVLSGSFMFLFQKSLYKNILDMEEQTKFSGGIFAILGLFSIVINFLGAKGLWKNFSAKRVFSTLPKIYLFFIILLFFYHYLWLITLAMVIFKVFDYSLYKASKEWVYTSLPLGASYEAKQIIDVIGYKIAPACLHLSLAFFAFLEYPIDPILFIIMTLAITVWLFASLFLAWTLPQNLRKPFP